MRATLFLLLTGSVAAQTFTGVPERLPASIGSALGPAVVDVDANGRVDLITSTTLLLHRADGFYAVPIPSTSTLGVIAGDADEDGIRELALLAANRPELVAYDPVGGVLGTPVRLPIATREFPLVQGSVWLDDDRDGHLDLLLGNDGPPDVLLRGDGAGGFTDVSPSVLPDVAGGTYGMAAADFDRDGDLDIAIGLCFPLPAENLLYRRDASGYVEIGDAAGAADPLASWGVAWLDFDGDGWLDLYSANMQIPQDGGELSPGFNALFRNDRDGTFTEVATQAGVAGPIDEDSWSALAADFDNDGHIDLFVANQPEDSRLYRNRGDGTFEDVTVAAGLTGLASTGISAGDVDGDGWVDLFIPGSSGRLFLNDGGTSGWLAVRLRGTTSNPDGVGARVEVTAGGRTQVREISAGDGMMAHSHALEAHVGLGTATEADVTVYWPSGEVTTVTGVAARQRPTIVEGEGRNDPPGLFSLLDVVSASPGAPATLSWTEASDPDEVTYTVMLRHESGTEVTRTTTDTALEVDLALEGEYRWTVRATDGRSVRLADAPGVFVAGIVAAEPAPPPGMSLSIGPSPTTGLVTVRLSGLRTAGVVEAFDLLGRRVASEAMFGAGGASTVTLDLRDVPAGAYLIRATAGVERASASVVVAE